MTTKTISGYYAAGYSLSTTYSELDITTTGGVGGAGVFSGHFATILNAGRIDAAVAENGIRFSSGGRVINGLTGFIGGDRGVVITGYGDVTNEGTIEGDRAGVSARSGAYGVVNGSLTNADALIQGGHNGVVLRGNGSSAINYGTIVGTGSSGGAGIVLHGGHADAADGVTLTNGAAGHANAVIEGYVGVMAGRGDPDSVINYGTIAGTGRVAVLFSTNRDTLVVEAGCAFDGAILGHGGALALANGVGTLEGLVGRDVTVSGSMATTNFTRFNVVRIGAAAQFTLAGSEAIRAGRHLCVDGRLDVPGGATLTVNQGAELTVDHGTLGGAGALILASGSVSSFTATQLPASITIENGEVALIDAIVNAGTVSVAGRATVSIVGETTLSGGGTLALSDDASNILFGDFGDLTNVDNTISGAGRLGVGQQIGLINETAGVIDANQSHALIISVSAVVNAGLIEATGAGGLVISSPVNNTGTLNASRGDLTVNGVVNNTGVLSASGGSLTVNGAVTGAGQATIDRGKLDFTSSFNEKVIFTGATGVLELGQSQSYTNTITGFSTGGGTRLDLRDIGFVDANEATFSGTTTSGVLTVSDGVHTAHINLKGYYLGSTFTAASDGRGGTIIRDPTHLSTSVAPWMAPSSGQRFIAAMAGMADGGAALNLAVREAWGGASPRLSAPRAYLA